MKEDNYTILNSIGITIERPAKVVEWKIVNKDGSPLTEEQIEEVIKILKDE